MDYLEFIAHSEWPLVAAAGLWLYRKPIAQVLGELRPKKFKGFGIDAEFETSLQKAEELLPPKVTAEKAPQIEQKSSPTMAFDELPAELAPPSNDRPTQTVYVPPRPLWEPTSADVAILRAFNSLEETVQRVYRLEVGDPTVRPNPNEAASAIGFTDDEIAAFNELRSLRNRVAHRDVTNISELEVRRFEAVAGRLNSRAFELYQDWQKRGMPTRAAKKNGGGRTNG